MDESTKGFGRVRLFLTAALFGVAVLVLLGISLYAFVIRDDLAEARKEVQEFRSISRSLNELRSLVITVESSQRGYLIVGTGEYLDSYREASQERRNESQSLMTAVSRFGNLRTPLMQLTELIDEREKDLENAAALRQSNDFSAVSRAVLADSSRKLNLEIRRGFVEIGDALERLQTDSEARYQSQIDRLMFLLKSSAFTALGSGLVGLVFLLGHVREQQRSIALEEEKRLAERSDREKTKFLASMNHEIRTPLNAMLGFSELLETEVSSKRGKRFLNAIQTSGGSLAELINDILDLSKIESGALDLDPEPTHLGEFVNGITIMFEEQVAGKGVKFTSHIADDCPSVVMLDGLRLRQVLINLLGNAIKFTDEGFIELRVSSPPFEGKDRDPSHCQLHLEVEDSGRGIEASKQKAIFQPFKQARTADEQKGGTGLGLSISRELVLLMGGKLLLTSEPGKGSIFTTVLPEVEICEGTKQSDRVDAVEKDFDDLPPSSILVVDDNAYNRELIGSFLETTHHTVAFAENGAEALIKMRELSPDLVFMDIRMPVMTGDEARQRMLEDDTLAEIPVIAVTASSLMSQEKRLRRMFDGYLRKPFSGKGLLEGMQKTLARSGDSANRVEKEVEPGSESKLDGDLQDADQLIESLCELRDGRWKGLREAMVFGEVLDAADVLSDLGDRHNAGILSDYASELRSYVKAFDQTSLEQSLARFDHLIDQLQNVGSR